MNWKKSNPDAPWGEDEWDAFAVGRSDAEARIGELEKALEAAAGYLLNAKIDLETGATKRTAIQTIEGGLKLVRTALSKRQNEQAAGLDCGPEEARQG